MNNIKEEREKFRGKLRKLFKSFSSRIYFRSPKNFFEEISKEEAIPVLIVSRVADYDLEKNELWELEANKSYPRKGLLCGRCKSLCVMSNSLYEAYKSAPELPEVVCGECFFKFIQKAKENNKLEEIY